MWRLGSETNQQKILSCEPEIFPITNLLFFEEKMEFKNRMKESTSRSCRRHYSRGFHLLIEQVSVISYCLHYSRHWVLNSEQHREPIQGSELWLLGTTSGSNIFLLGVFCNITCVSNIILADNLQSKDCVKDFRQSILLLNTMKKGHRKRKKFSLFFDFQRAVGMIFTSVSINWFNNLFYYETHIINV